MIKDSDQARQQMLTDAFTHLQSAIDLLDSADAPGNIAAHADLAARQLEELLPVENSPGSRGRIRSMERGQQPCHPEFSRRGERDPRHHQAGISAAADQSAFFEHDCPTGKCRRRDVGDHIGKPRRLTAQPGCEEIEEDIPRRVGEQPGAERAGPRAAQPQDVLDLPFCPGSDT